MRHCICGINPLSPFGYLASACNFLREAIRLRPNAECRLPFLFRPMLTEINLLDPLDRVSFFGRLVGTKPDDARETQRETAFVPIRSHYVVEGDFKNDPGLDQARVAEISQGVLLEPFRHLCNLGIG